MSCLLNCVREHSVDLHLRETWDVTGKTQLTRKLQLAQARAQHPVLMETKGSFECSCKHLP